MTYSETIPRQQTGDTSRKAARVAAEAVGLLRGPQRIFPLMGKVIVDGMQTRLLQRHLYFYANTTRQSSDALRAVIGWILNAQREDGGIAAFYSLLSGYSASYPEVTGYIIPKTPQSEGDKDRQFFVMHDMLKAHLLPPLTRHLVAWVTVGSDE